MTHCSSFMLLKPKGLGEGKQRSCPGRGRGAAEWEWLLLISSTSCVMAPCAAQLASGCLSHRPGAQSTWAKGWEVLEELGPFQAIVKS